MHEARLMGWNSKSTAAYWRREAFNVSAGIMRTDFSELARNCFAHSRITTCPEVRHV
jgi:hypothetical protein